MADIGVKYVGCSESNIWWCISVAFTASREMFNIRKHDGLFFLTFLDIVETFVLQYTTCLIPVGKKSVFIVACIDTPRLSPCHCVQSFYAEFCFVRCAAK